MINQINSISQAVVNENLHGNIEGLQAEIRSLREQLARAHSLLKEHNLLHVSAGGGVAQTRSPTAPPSGTDTHQGR